MENKLMDPILIHRRYYQMMKDGELSNRQIGVVVMALISYQTEAKVPRSMGPVCRAFWKFIYADMKREFGEGIR